MENFEPDWVSGLIKLMKLPGEEYCTQFGQHTWIHRAFFSVGVIMLIISVVSAIKYKTYRNTESFTMIGIVTLKWLWFVAIWGCFVWQPEWFLCHMMTLLDLTSYVDFYLWGITNLVVFLQWAQVYRVITNPEDASETLAHNWAVKMQCTFIIYFTIMIIASMYFGAWAHKD